MNVQAPIPMWPVTRADAVADQTELAGLGDDVAGADGFVVDVQRRDAGEAGLFRVRVRALHDEVDSKDVASRGDFAIGFDGLQVGTDPVEHVLEPLALHVQRVAAGDASVRVEDAFGIPGIEFDAGRDRV